MLEKFDELLKKIDGKPNWVSAIGHGLVCVAWLTFGLILAFISLLADESLAMPIIIFFSGMDIGGYGLRELEHTRKGQPLGHGFEDFLGAVVFTIPTALFYASLVS